MRTPSPGIATADSCGDGLLADCGRNYFSGAGLARVFHTARRRKLRGRKEPAREQEHNNRAALFCSNQAQGNSTIFLQQQEKMPGLGTRGLPLTIIDERSFDERRCLWISRKLVRLGQCGQYSAPQLEKGHMFGPT